MIGGKTKPARGGRPLDAHYQRLARDPEWVCQAKIDGWRAVAYRGVLRTRSGNPIDAPAVVSALPAHLAIEGEWHKPSGTFYAFDMPAHPGSYAERWRALVEALTPCQAVQLIPHRVTWADVAANGWEGVVFKWLPGRYPCAGVTPVWMKYRAAWLA